MTAAKTKVTAPTGEPARSEGGWDVTGAVPREDGIRERAVSVSWVRGMSGIYHMGDGLSAISHQLIALPVSRFILPTDRLTDFV
jgi:hypothetical protein